MALKLLGSGQGGKRCADDEGGLSFLYMNLSQIRLWIWAMGLIVSGLVAFSPGLQGPFILDDVAKIRDNPNLRNPVPSFSEFFESYESNKTHFRNDPSRPLTYFIYWAIYQLEDGQPQAFHLFNVGLHIGLSLILGLIVLELGVTFPLAVVVSFIFLLHPLGAGTVLYAFGLSDILTAFLTALMTLLILKKKTSIVLHVGLFLLALAAKQSAIVIPALVFALNPKNKKLILALSATAMSYLVFRFAYYGRIGDLEAVDVYPRLDYLLAQGGAILKYIGLFLWPSHLSIDHAIFPRSFPILVKYTGWALWLLLSGFAIKAILQPSPSTKRNLALGWLFFALPLFPTGSVFPTTDIFVERRVYGSMIGLLIIFSTALKLYSNRILITIIALLTGLLATMTFKRSQIHASDIAIYQENVRLYPDDERSLNNLATAYLQAGQAREARPILERLLIKYPNHRDTLVNLSALLQMPEYGEVDLRRAGELLERLLQNEPTNLMGLLNYGFLKNSEKDFVKARASFHRALELSPCMPNAFFGLGLIEQQLKNQTQAKAEFEKALQCDPRFEPAKEALSHF